jgi:hypothetical protein
MAIDGATVDVPLQAMDQIGPITSTPLGQLELMENAVCNRYTEGTPARIRVSKRSGFSPLTTTTKTPSTGLDAVPMDNVKLLTTFADQQLLAIGSARPFVYAEHAPWWERVEYPILTQSLTQEYVHVDNSQDAIPDACGIGGIYLYTWATLDGAVWAKFVDDDGTPIRTPFQVRVSGRIKCVDDGTYFWIFTDENTASVRADVYGTDGVLIASTGAATNPHDSWDVTYDVDNGVNFLYLNGSNAPTIIKLEYAPGPGFTSTPRSFTSIVIGPQSQCTFLTNETTDGYLYIAVVADIDGDDFVSAYKLPSTGTTVADSWDFAPQFVGIVNIAGYAILGGVRIYVSIVDALNQQNNYSHVFSGLAGGATEDDGKIFGATVASRAFNIGVRETHSVILYYASRSTVVINGNSFAGQPTYFIHDMESKKVVGRFNYGYAAMDWPCEASGRYKWHLSTPFIDGVYGQYHVALGVNGESIIKTLPTGSDIILTFRKFVSTVGIMDTMLGDHGQATEYAGELFIPGPVATVFTGSGFSESGVNLAPEQPSVSQEVGAGMLATGHPYSWVVVFEWTNPNGERARSQTTVPVSYTLSGVNNTARLTGRHLSLTGHTDLIISIYRNIYITASVSAVNPSVTASSTGSGMSIEHYKITSDLDPMFNDPTADPNTWEFVDTITDEAAAVGELLYTDAGFLQRDPAPAHRDGCISDNRVILAGYDGALWISGEKTPGEALWFNGDALRITMPTSDPVRVVRQMDNRIYIGCEKSWWWVPSTGFPDATGQNGNLRTPERLPFNNGCTGHAKVTRDGILYVSSADNQPWVITREMTNVHAGAPAVADFEGTTVTGMATDADQRTILAVTDGPGEFTPYLMVYDPLCKAWGKWKISGAVAFLPTTFRGRFHFYDDSQSIWRQIPNQWFDHISTRIITKVKVGPVHIGGVKNYKRIWDILIYGDYLDDHDMKVTVDYDDNGGLIQTIYNFTPSSSVPYLYKLRPVKPLCSSLSFTFEDSFPRSNGSEGYALEMISFYVALEKGLARMSSTLTIPAGDTVYIVPGVGGSGMAGAIVTVDEISDLGGLTVGGLALSAMTSGRTIAWVKSTGRFYVLDATEGDPEDPPDYNLVDAADGRQWFLT